MAVSIPKLLQSKWQAFVSAGVTTTCTYKSMELPTYNGGVVTKNVISQHPGTEIIFTAMGGGSLQKYQAMLVDGETIKKIDKVAVFPSLNLPVVPKINDFIVDPSAVSFKVKAVALDPANAAYELWVRPHEES